MTSLRQRITEDMQVRISAEHPNCLRPTNLAICTPLPKVTRTARP